jgi:hypothetical protein
MVEIWMRHGNPKVLNDLLVKVDRAYKHIVDLSTEFIRFVTEGHPYGTFFEDNPNTGERTYYLRIRKEMPPQFSALIGDVAQNLRSSLDHLAWHLVQSSPVNPKARDQDIYFPIAETASEYNAGKMRKIEGMTDAAIKAIDRIEPYYGLDGVGIGQGVQLFWLDKINKLDKHRLLVPVWTNMVSHAIPRTKLAELSDELRAALGPGKAFIAANALSPGPLKDGSKLYTLPISEVDDDMAFRFHVAFGEPKWVRGKEVVTTLTAIHKRVEQIIIDFDNEGLL